MAEVTGFTADRMLAMEDATVIDAHLDGYDLILVTKDNTEINVGNVRGQIGPIGPVGEVPEAPNDTERYVRSGELWVPLDVVSDGAEDGDILEWQTDKWVPGKREKIPTEIVWKNYGTTNDIGTTVNSPAVPGNNLEVTVTNNTSSTRIVKARLSCWVWAGTVTNSYFVPIPKNATWNGGVAQVGYTSARVNAVDYVAYQHAIGYNYASMAPGSTQTFMASAWKAGSGTVQIRYDSVLTVEDIT